MSYGPDNTSARALETIEDRHERAFAVWFETMDYAKAAKAVGIPTKQVKDWSERFRWGERARELTMEIQDHWRKVVAEIQLRGAKSLFSAEIALIERLQAVTDRILKNMEHEKAPKVKDLKVLAEVARSLAQVAERLFMPRTAQTTVNVDKRKVIVTGIKPVGRVQNAPQLAIGPVGLPDIGHGPELKS